MVLVFGALGALAVTACGGDSDPNGKTGGGLGPAKGGSSGSGSGAKGGTGGGISLTGGSSAGGSSSVGVGGGVSVGGSTSGSSGSVGSGGFAGADACASVTEDTNKIEVALLFMVDISGSMNCPVPEQDPPCEVDPNKTFPQTRWTEMSPALKGFFDSMASAGMWAGISFFSRNGSCNESDYEKPDSEIALLPAAAMNLDSVVDKQKPAGSTPTVPALEGALTHAGDWAAAHPDQNVVVVYATDGYPMGCDKNTIDVAAKDAADAFNGPHQIRTYVLGVGPNLSDLNSIAMSGGTDMAELIDTGQDVTSQLTAKFNAIRSAVAVDCTYAVPAPPAGQTLDPNKVNVEYNGTEIGYNNTATCDQGWQYANNNSQVVLCGSTCDQVKADANAKINISFGCETVVIGQPR
ncbi:MAG TPA: vWA domain-containing protein [Polyangiaceae bacterium]|nr:vWA domain-containing protein [Polyangiaceae bacterium]